LIENKEEKIIEELKQSESKSVRMLEQQILNKNKNRARDNRNRTKICAP